MISFDFEYHRPVALDEALELYRVLSAAGKKVIYYGGGSEIITFSRQGRLSFDALVDIRQVPETTLFELKEEQLTVGAALTLTTLADSDRFALLSAVARRVADRTVRNRLTLGGNICGSLPYREALLPFLLCDAQALVAGPTGQKREPLQRLFTKRLRLAPGEILVALTMPAKLLQAPGWHKRREQHGPVNYPLVHTVVLKPAERITVAVSGLCAYPFREEAVEDALNDRALGPEERIEKALGLLPGAIRDDELASADYRKALWRQDLLEMFQEMGETG